MRKHQQSAAGFTLIEVLVVVAIIGIASATTFSSLAARRAERALEQSSRELAVALREAQNYALSGRSTALNEDNCAYGVYATAGSPTYVLRNTYRSAGACTEVGTVASYSLKGGVVALNQIDVIYALPRAEAFYLNGSVTRIVNPITLTLARGAARSYLCVYSSGRVVENGSNSTCP